MSLDQLLTEAMRLSPSEKAALAATLWESLGDPFDSETTLQEDIALAKDRDHQLATGAADAIPHEEMMRRLRQ